LILVELIDAANSIYGKALWQWMALVLILLTSICSSTG